MKIQHHKKYKEIHGEDEVVEMDVGEHLKLHRRLRREGCCNVPVEELRRIAIKAHNRTEKRKQYLRNRLKFSDPVHPDFYLIEVIRLRNNSVSVLSYFEVKSAKKN